MTGVQTCALPISSMGPELVKLCTSKSRGLVSAAIFAFFFLTSFLAFSSSSLMSTSGIDLAWSLGDALGSSVEIGGVRGLESLDDGLEGPFAARMLARDTGDW